MNAVIRRVLDRALELNERVADTIGNGFDWLFRHDDLVKSGRTWFELVHDGDPMSVRYYELPEENEIELADGSHMPIERNRYAIPLVLVPPLGVTTETFDLLPNRSLARYMSARGYKTYLIDWGKPEKRHAHLGMKDYADTMMSEALQKIRQHSGVQQVSLMGWCMGGLLCLMHAGLKRDARIANIVTIASPIDLRGGGMVAGVAQALNTPARLIRKYTQFRLHSLDPVKLHLPAWTTTLAFKLTDPIGSVTTYWDLITRLWDREFVESHSTTSNYLNNMLVYPAGMVQDMIVNVAVDNKLAKGEIELGKKISRFKNISAPMLVFAGERDVLVPASIARRIIELVSSTDKRFEIAPGGHMGVILGSAAQKVVWLKTADWLASRSATPKRAASRTAAPKKPTKERRTRRTRSAKA
jgi:polyhydroxyalkanoate synthase